MTRITCKTPSTGKGINIYKSDITSSYETISDAPDFSVPDPSNQFENRDPLDDTRAIRPGEIFFLTPLAARNKDTETRWIETRFVDEDTNDISFGRVEVPSGDTVLIPLQGRSLFKRSANTSIGDVLQVRAEANNVFDVWISGEEKLSSEHIQVTDIS